MENTVEEMQYATYLLPRATYPAFVKKFARMNRDAARSIPGLILYRAHEMSWTDAQWTKQLQDPRKFHFICVSKQSSSNDEKLPTLKTGKWVGMCSWLGPLSRDECSPSDSDCSDSSDDEKEENETFWHAGRLYLRPAHRNMSAFASMMEACTNFVRTYTAEHLEPDSGHCRGRMRSTISPNSSMGPLYQATGAHHIDFLTLHESLEANHSLRDVSKEALTSLDYTERDRPLLEWLVEC